MARGIQNKHTPYYSRTPAHHSIRPVFCCRQHPRDSLLLLKLDVTCPHKKAETNNIKTRLKAPQGKVGKGIWVYLSMKSHGCRVLALVA